MNCIFCDYYTLYIEHILIYFTHFFSFFIGYIKLNLAQPHNDNEQAG